MIYWRIEPHMIDQGWRTAYQLAKETGISRPTAARVLSGAPVERVDTDVLLLIAKRLGLRNPLVLLEYRRE